MSALKDCPICRSKAKLIKASDDKRRQTNKIECTNHPCIYIERAAMFGVESIIKIWNTRTPDQSTQKVVDAAIKFAHSDNDDIAEEEHLVNIVMKYLAGKARP